VELGPTKSIVRSITTNDADRLSSPPPPSNDVFAPATANTVSPNATALWLCPTAYPPPPVPVTFNPNKCNPSTNWCAATRKVLREAVGK
jgi:hypothetical protein